MGSGGRIRGSGESPGPGNSGGTFWGGLGSTRRPRRFCGGRSSRGLGEARTRWSPPASFAVSITFGASRRVPCLQLSAGGGSPYSPLPASSGPPFPHLQSDRLRSVGGSVGRGSHGGGGASPPTLASLLEVLSTGGCKQATPPPLPLSQQK